MFFLPFRRPRREPPERCRCPSVPSGATYDRRAVVESGPKSSRVLRLQEDDRVAELARMLVGLSDTDNRARARP